MTYEKLIIENPNLTIIELDLSGTIGLKGLCIDDCIAIEKDMTLVEKSCILAEELGHHHTSSGNILDLSDVRNRKQELKARVWAYNNQIGLSGLIKAFKHGCHGKTEVAEFLDVTEDFLEEAVECYRNKYGLCTAVDNYLISFEPTLGISKLY